MVPRNVHNFLSGSLADSSDSVCRFEPVVSYVFDGDFANAFPPILGRFSFRDVHLPRTGHPSTVYIT